MNLSDQQQGMLLRLPDVTFPLLILSVMLLLTRYYQKPSIIQKLFVVFLDLVSGQSKSCVPHHFLIIACPSVVALFDRREKERTPPTW